MSSIPSATRFPSAKQESATLSKSLECSSLRSPLKTESGGSYEKPCGPGSVSEEGSRAPDGDVGKQERNQCVQQAHNQQVSQTSSQQTVLDEPSKIPQTHLQQNSQNATHPNPTIQISSNGPQNAPPTTSQQISLNVSSQSPPNISSHTPQNFSQHPSQKGQQVSQAPPQQVLKSAVTESQKMSLVETQNSPLESFQKRPHYPPHSPSQVTQNSAQNVPSGVQAHLQDKQSNLRSEQPGTLKMAPFTSTGPQMTRTDHHTHSEPPKQRVSGGGLESQDNNNSNMMRSAPPNGHLKQSVSAESHSLRVEGLQVAGATHSQVMPPAHHGANDPTAHYNHSGQTNPLYMQHMGKSLQSPNGQHLSQNVPQNMNMHPMAARYPPYRHHVPYSYHMMGKPPEGHPNVFPQYQQHHYYPQQQGNRSGFLTEEWHRAQYTGPGNAYPPQANGNGRLKESSISPMSSDGTGGNLISPNPLSNRSHSGPVEAKEAISSVKPAQLEEHVDRAESPKEILDLDSHRLAGQSRPAYPQHSANRTYDPQTAHGGMQHDGGAHPLHMMTRVTYPPQHYARGHYSPQQPNSHLMEALQRPQQLPFPPGHTHMAMRRPPPGPHYHGRMPPQSGLPPEHYFHPR